MGSCVTQIRIVGHAGCGSTSALQWRAPRALLRGVVVMSRAVHCAALCGEDKGIATARARARARAGVGKRTIV